MTEFKQPWRPVKIDGRRARLQILDPQTAFEWEPTLIEVLGDTLSLAVSSPDQIMGTVIARATAAGRSAGLDLRACLTDPEYGPEMAADVIGTVGAIVASVLDGLRLNSIVVKRMFAAFTYNRLRIGDTLIEDSETWVDARLSPLAKWQVLAAQIRQTYGPMWLRKSYQVRSEVKTYGVPVPSDVPIAVRWADNLARNKSASSSHEILTTWTPLRMIEVVENTAYQNEIEKRAAKAARAGEK